jgi:hypothetical protein
MITPALQKALIGCAGAAVAVAILKFYRSGAVAASAQLSSCEARGAEPVRRGTMILVEAMDLAGKTSLTKSLRDKLKQSGRRTSFANNALVPANRIAQVADDFRKEKGAGLVETGAMFLAAHLLDATMFKYPAVGEVRPPSPTACFSSSPPSPT